MDLLGSKPSIVWCDSQAAIAVVYRAEKTRSYPRNAAVRIMHVREAVDNGDITIRYVHTSENRADLRAALRTSPRKPPFVWYVATRAAQSYND
jgi:hypothetical protein